MIEHKNLYYCQYTYKHEQTNKQFVSPYFNNISNNFFESFGQRIFPSLLCFNNTYKQKYITLLYYHKQFDCE